VDDGVSSSQSTLALIVGEVGSFAAGQLR